MESISLIDSVVQLKIPSERRLPIAGDCRRFVVSRKYWCDAPLNIFPFTSSSLPPPLFVLSHLGLGQDVHLPQMAVLERTT
jgi:hypothetical protein